MVEFTGATGTPRAAHYRDVTWTWVLQLYKRFQLRTEVNEQQYLGPSEARILIARTLDNPPCFTNAIQQCISVVLGLYVGARGSSIPSEGIAMFSFKSSM